MNKTDKTMNRIIKFRAWDGKVMHSIVDYIHYGMSNNLEYLGIGGDGELPYRQLKQGEFVLLQFTGLLDKHGKEIYVGDIVAFAFETKPEWFRYEIVWDFLGFNLKNINNGRIHFPFEDDLAIDVLKHHLSKVEVIGNIYENPDLLRKKEE